jgi:uncharacterized RDD family membrane protein YckC
MKRDSDDLTIMTPEHVGIRFLLAGLGSRSLAFLLDSLFRILFITALVVLGLILGHFIPALDPTGTLMRLSATWLVALGVLVYTVIDLGYFLLFEGFWEGQTPGKRILGLRVIRVDGRPIGWTESALRNLLRAVDLLAGLYPLGLLLMFLTPRCQRLGDMAAGTVVVAEPKEAPPVMAGEPSEEGRFSTSGVDVTRMEAKDYRVIRRFLQRRNTLEATHRSQIARVLAGRLMRRWRLAPRPDLSYEDFLEAVVRAYERKRRFL